MDVYKITSSCLQNISLSTDALLLSIDSFSKLFQLLTSSLFFVSGAKIIVIVNPSIAKRP